MIDINCVLYRNVLLEISSAWRTKYRMHVLYEKLCILLSIIVVTKYFTLIGCMPKVLAHYFRIYSTVSILLSDVLQTQYRQVADNTSALSIFLDLNISWLKTVVKMLTFSQISLRIFDSLSIEDLPTDAESLVDYVYSKSCKAVDWNAVLTPQFCQQVTREECIAIKEQGNVCGLLNYSVLVPCNVHWKRAFLLEL